jgi:hypothetical protein
MSEKYKATVTEGGNVSITRDRVFVCNGRLDPVCLARGEVHIVDADAPLGDDAYDALDAALTEAMERGEDSATVAL